MKSCGSCTSPKIFPTRGSWESFGNAATSATHRPLVPIERPFMEGCRYREAGVLEVRSRFDLYHEDPAGEWIRRHGVLIWRGQ